MYHWTQNRRNHDEKREFSEMRKTDKTNLPVNPCSPPPDAAAPAADPAPPAAPRRCAGADVSRAGPKGPGTANHTHTNTMALLRCCIAADVEASTRRSDGG